MKLMILLALIVCAGIALTFLAMSLTRPELAAEQTAAPPAAEKQQLPSAMPVTAPRVEQVATAPVPAILPAHNVTREACLALEQRLLEDLEDARQDLRRAQRDYDDAVETYEDALDSDQKDPQQIAQLRKEKETTKVALEDAEGEYDNAVKRLSRARIECGLFS